MGQAHSNNSDVGLLKSTNPNSNETSTYAQRVTTINKSAIIGNRPRNRASTIRIYNFKKNKSGYLDPT